MPRRACSILGLRGGEGLEECFQIHGLETKNGIRDGSVGCGAHPKDAFIARAAVTRDHRLGVLHRRHFFLITAPREEAGRGGGQRKDLEGDTLERGGSFPERRPPCKNLWQSRPHCVSPRLLPGPLFRLSPDHQRAIPSRFSGFTHAAHSDSSTSPTPDPLIPFCLPTSHAHPAVRL